jgi:hypothetical protein
MAAGLGFIEFATGDILTAAAANGYLASQSVMVFADAAARTSAITSPQEGMISYLKSTDAVEKYNGSAWVSIAAASASGLTFITKSTASAVSSHTISNCFTSAYTNYRIVWNLSAVQNAASDLTLQMTASGTAATSGYNSERLFAAAGSASADSDNQGTDEWNFMFVSNTFPNSPFGSIEIGTPEVAVNTTFNSQGYSRNATTQYFFINGGFLNNTSQYDGIKILSSSGTFSGDFYVYGYQKA